jgi:hypothetical protein
MKTEQAAKERPERPVPSSRENVGHIIVEAHGATDISHTPDQTVRKHELADTEIAKGDVKRNIKKSGVAERHVTQEDGLVTAKRREQSVLQNRTESAKCFDSKRKSVSRQG